MDEEKQKREIQQLLSGFIELKTEKETEKAALNVLQIDIQWRDLLREAKSKELQEELHQMKQAFTRAVDYKDSAISLLQTQLEQTEIQNAWTSCQHMKTLEKLIALEHRRSENLFELYEKDLAELKKSYTETKALIEKKFESNCVWFHDLDFIEETLFQEFKEKTAKEYLLMGAEISQEVEKEKDNVTKSFDARIQVTWKRFQSALVKYLEDAAAMEKMFHEFKEEYEATIADAENDVKTHKELKSSIPQLKAQIEERKRDHLQRMTKTASGHDKFYNNMNEVKSKIFQLRKDDKEALTQLITNSSITMRELKRLVSKGEKIMRLHKRIKRLEEMCGREIVRESFLNEEDLEEVKKHSELTIPQNIHMDMNCRYLLQLEKFWERHNTVVLHNLALKKELYELDLYSRKLHSEMNTFLQSVSEAKTARSLKVKVKAVPPVIQEASILAKNL